MSMPTYDPSNDPNAQAGGVQQPYGQVGATQPAYAQPAYGPNAQQQPYAQPPYGQGYGQPPRQANDGLGIAALVLGILGVVFCGLGLIPGTVAIFLGVAGRKRAKRGEATNGGVALAGIITGAVGVVISLAVIAYVVLLILVGGTGTYTSCVSDAHGDRVQIRQCDTQFPQNR